MILLRSQIVFLHSVNCLFIYVREIRILLNTLKKPNENLIISSIYENWAERKIFKCTRNYAVRLPFVTISFCFLCSDLSWNNYKQFKSLIIGRKNAFQHRKLFLLYKQNVQTWKAREPDHEGMNERELNGFKHAREQTHICVSKSESFVEKSKFFWKRNRKT